MKMNKLFSLIMAGAMAIGFVACGGEEPPTPPTPGTALSVSPEKATLNVGETVTLEANKDDVTWNAVSSSNAVEISAKAGKSIVVTAKAAGAASVIATSGEDQVIISITVSGGSGSGTNFNIEATEIYPLLLAQEVFEANASKIVKDLRPDPAEGRNIDIWNAGETYSAGEGSSKGYFGLPGFMAFTVVAPDKWSGGGFNLGAAAVPTLEALVAKIKADPDKYFLHIGMKSVDAASHMFYIFAQSACYYVIGSTPFIDKGVPYAPFTDIARDGAWHGLDLPMAKYASQLPSKLEGGYALSFLSGSTPGVQLNLDAVYFYKK